MRTSTIPEVVTLERNRLTFIVGPDHGMNLTVHIIFEFVCLRNTRCTLSNHSYAEISGIVSHAIYPLTATFASEISPAIYWPKSEEPSTLHRTRGSSREGLQIWIPVSS